MTGLFGADAGSFVATTGDAPPVTLYNRPWEYLERYSVSQHLDDAIRLWNGIGRPGVFSTATLTRGNRSIYTNSSIYSEVYRHYDVEDGIGTFWDLRTCVDDPSLSFREGDTPVSGNFNLYADRAGSAACSDDAMALLMSLRPLLRSASQSWIDLAWRRNEMASMIDSFGDALAMHSRDGRKLHQNTALTKLLSEDVNGHAVEDAMRQLNLEYANGARFPGTTFESSVDTGFQRYRLRATSAASLLPYVGAVLITVQPMKPNPPAVEEIMRRFEFTRREAEVARLLAVGASNKSISAVLGIAEPTARHHTQRVLTKLRISSRSAVLHALRNHSLC
jgi:DNA-binding CsgD family transcriptional regulator